MSEKKLIEIVEEDKYPIAVNRYKSIKEWREDERPREKLDKHGPSALSDAELIAILLGTSSVKGSSAIDVAKELLGKYENISGIAGRTVAELQKIKGIGPAKAIMLASAFELGKRSQTEIFHPIGQIYSPDQVAQYYIPRMKSLNKEVFRVLLLSSANKIKKEVIVSEGILNASLVHPREVFAPAVTEMAAAIILMHNHPSGNCKASQEDIDITKKLVEAGKLMDIKVLDHIIISGSTFMSFTREGLI